MLSHRSQGISLLPRLAAEARNRTPQYLSFDESLCHFAFYSQRYLFKAESGRCWSPATLAVRAKNSSRLPFAPVSLSRMVAPGAVPTEYVSWPASSALSNHPSKRSGYSVPEP